MVQRGTAGRQDDGIGYVVAAPCLTGMGEAASTAGPAVCFVGFKTVTQCHGRFLEVGLGEKVRRLRPKLERAESIIARPISQNANFIFLSSYFQTQRMTLARDGQSHAIACNPVGEIKNEINDYLYPCVVLRAARI
jgi:hypothetical protein